MEKLSGKNGKVLYDFAVWCEQEGLWKMASKVTAYIIQHYPQSKWLPHVYYIRAKSLTHLEKYQSALAVYDSVVTRYPRHGLALEMQYQMGEINFKHLNDVDRALQYYNRLLKKNRKGTRVFDALFRIGDCYVKNGDLKSAHKMYLQLERQVRHNKDLTDKARYKRAEAFFLGNNIKEARALLEKTINDPGENLFTNDALVLLMLLEQGQPDELALFTKAEFCQRQYKYLEARREWKKLTTSFPGSRLVPEARMRIAGVLVLSNMPQEALLIYRRVAEQEGQGTITVKARVKIGEIYEAYLKDIPQAVEEYKKIIEEFPASPLVPKVRKRLRELMKMI